MALDQAIKPGQPLAALAEYDQFIHWTVKQNPKTGKDYKVTVNPVTGANIDSQDPFNWMSADAALAVVDTSPHVKGVGFVFTEADPFIFVDIDKCVTDSGEWSSVAQDLMGRLSGAAVEVSQSGKGLHIFGKCADMPHSCKDATTGTECYTSKRFVALTGAQAVGDASVDITMPMVSVIAQYFPPRVAIRDVEWSDSATHPDWCGPSDDDELISAACNAVSASAAFGSGVTFRQLWEADEVALATHYPDSYGDRAWDGSSVDAALVMHLAFWTGGNHERIKSLMLQTPHVRDKWDRVEGYLEPTIANGVRMQGAAYNSPKYRPLEESPEMQAVLSAAKNPTSPASAPAATAATAGGAAAPAVPVVTGVISSTRFLPVIDQLSHFSGCCYIRDMHQIFTPRGEFMDHGRFRASFGGYNFALDGSNDKTTKSAWEAFTESQGYDFPQVATSRFRPQEPSGDVRDDTVNVYVDPQVPCVEGDVGPFLSHLARVFPNAEDRLILLSYFAGIVQYQGYKSPWAVLLQGAPGNGKSILTDILEEAIGRKYCHRPSSSDIDNKFNAWMENKILASVEDIYVSDRRKDIIETLKPMITGTHQEIQAKGRDQKSAEICANFLFNSNHKDGIRKTRDDRRFCVIYSAQQEAEDLKRDGMDGDYFPNLLDWLRVGGGYAHITHYLRSFSIPVKYDFTKGAVRAPISSSTESAIAESVGVVEQEVLEAIEEGRVGFRGGWVSSIHLTSLLESKRLAARVPNTKRGAMLKELGFIPHPALSNGRVNNPIACDGGKPRLYIQEDEVKAGMATKDVAIAYETAQALEVFP